MRPTVRCCVPLALLTCSVAAQSSQWTVEQAISNIIPTPQEITRPLAGTAAEEWVLLGDKTLIALGEATTPPPQESAAAQALIDAIVRAGGEATIVDAEDFSPGDSSFIVLSINGQWPHGGGLTPDQVQQSYRVTPAEGRGFIVEAPSSLGLLYGAVSLCAMIVPHEGAAAAPRAGILDYPDIAYRWGGNGAFLGLEPKENVRWCMSHKINLLPSPIAYQYSTARLEAQLELNRHARRNGVRVLNLVFGNVATRNRRSYPDGETYACMDEGSPSTGGWCLTGEALIAEKCRKLTEFVDATEPGCLYIHFVDEDDLRDSTEVWSNRCDECRRQFPNDDVWTEDGKAGAQARVFDAFCDAIFSVKHQQSGYDASRDCLIIFVSCPYTVWSENDDVWDREVEYHCTVSRGMKHVDNVHFCIRENGRRRDSGRKRCLELARALKQRGKGHQVMMYYLSGDSRQTRVPWPRPLRVVRRLMAGPAMTISFEGAGSILQAGMSDPLLKVEYSWNLEGSGFHLDPPTHQEWMKAFLGLMGDSLRPPEIVSYEGFLGRLCRHRYGLTVGPMMAGYYIPEVVEDAGGNELLPASGDKWLSINDAVWSTVSDPGMFGQLAQYCEAQTGHSDGFLQELEAGLHADDVPPAGQSHLQRVPPELRVGGALGQAQAAVARVASALLEDDHDRADAARRELNHHWLQAESHAGEDDRLGQAVKRRVKAAGGFLERMKMNAEPLRQRRAALQRVRQSGGDLRASLARSLSPDQGQGAVARAHLDGATIMVKGDMGPLAQLLEAAGAKCQSTGRQPLSEVVKTADVLCFSGSTSPLGIEDAALLLRYVEGGGAICVAAGAPFFMCGNNTHLTSIASWLGAEEYANYGGPLGPAGQTVLTEGLEMDDSMVPPGAGSACLTQPLHGLPVLVAQGSPALVSAMVCRQGKGRSAFVFSLGVSQEKPGSRSEFLVRLMAWLANTGRGD